jgi:LPXTG-motif cell wall-anchored protein
MGKKTTATLVRLVARGGAAILVTMSLAFASPSYAQQHDTGEAMSAQGQAHAARGHAPTHRLKHASATRSHATGGTVTTTSGGSAVNLPRPNDFQAQADPDGMENGGVDQPGGQGGIDTTTQDGNNGSGNDADCEDDNNGVGVPSHCKDRPGTDHPVTRNPVTSNPATGPEVAGPVLPTSSVGSGSAVQVAAPGVFAGSLAPAHVAAAKAAAAPAAGVLPNTGAGQALAALAIAGLAGLGIGAAILHQSRRTGPIAG